MGCLEKGAGVGAAQVATAAVAVQLGGRQRDLGKPQRLARVRATCPLPHPCTAGLHGVGPLQHGASQPLPCALAP